MRRFDLFYLFLAVISVAQGVYGLVSNGRDVVHPTFWGGLVTVLIVFAIWSIFRFVLFWLKARPKITACYAGIVFLCFFGCWLPNFLATLLWVYVAWLNGDHSSPRKRDLKAKAGRLLKALLEKVRQLVPQPAPKPLPLPVQA